MRPINLDEEIEFNPEHPATKMLRDSLGFRAVLFCLDEGQAIPRHPNPHEVLLNVYRGSGTIIVSDDEHAVKAGDMVVCRPNEVHGIRSEGEQMVVFALIVEMD